jgi:hypothetical protein
MTEWLDTETKALLQANPPDKMAPPDTGTFTLVLLAPGRDVERTAWAVGWICRCGEADAMARAAGQLPAVVAAGLSVEDALIGQFELVCCDCVSVFLADEVVEGADPDYLQDLYATLCQSSEFDEVTVEIRAVPDTPEGRKFLAQFLGPRAAAQITSFAGLPTQQRMMRKKARVLLHWADKVGADAALIEK